jgi:hypothetical protein
MYRSHTDFTDFRLYNLSADEAGFTDFIWVYPVIVGHPLTNENALLISHLPK